MIKWIGLILSFIMGRFNSHTPAMNFNFKDIAMGIFDDITFKSRKAVSLLLVALASVIFICGGFFISLIDATRQYDQQGVIAMSSTFLSGVVLAVVSIGIFTWVFASAWPGVKPSRTKRREEEFMKRMTPPTPPPPTSIEHALSALIMDIVHEREKKRETATSHSAPPPPRPRPNEDSAFNKEDIPPVYPH